MNKLHLVIFFILIVSVINVECWRRRRRRRRRTCSPRNCVWNSWQEWSPCSVACGNGGTQSRSRAVQSYASCGGSGCSGSSYQQRSCSGARRRNCMWTNWNEWSSCSVSCGSGGTQTKSRRIATSASCGGARCSGPASERRDCSGRPVINCVWNDWSSWTLCPTSCGINGASQTRTRMYTYPQCGGAECIGPTSEQRSCAIDCEWSDWGNWSPCSINCGSGGTETRNRTMATPAFCGGAECSGLSEEESTCSPGCARGTEATGKCENCPIPFIGDCCEQLGEGDPCTWHLQLREPWRSTNHLSTTGEFHCYSDLTNYWYRFNGEGGGEMPTKCVKSGSCGVLKPIWLSDDHPNYDEGSVIKKVCISESTDGETDCCTARDTVEVKNCNDEYYVYKLFQPEDCNQGFCAGKEIPCPPGTNSSNGYTPLCSYDPPSNIYFPVLEDILEDHTFVCSFEGRHYSNMSYTMKWYSSGSELQQFISPIGQGHSTTLGMEELRSTLGLTQTMVSITCTLSAQYIDPDNGATKSKLSEENESNVVDFNV